MTQCLTWISTFLFFSLYSCNYDSYLRSFISSKINNLAPLHPSHCTVDYTFLGGPLLITYFPSYLNELNPTNNEQHFFGRFLKLHSWEASFFSNWILSATRYDRWPPYSPTVPCERLAVRRLSCELSRHDAWL